MLQKVSLSPATAPSGRLISTLTCVRGAAGSCMLLVRATGPQNAECEALGVLSTRHVIPTWYQIPVARCDARVYTCRTSCTVPVIQYEYRYGTVPPRAGRVSTHPRVSKFPVRKRSLMEIRRRKRKWDTLGGGHSWDGTSYAYCLLLLIPRLVIFPKQRIDESVLLRSLSSPFQCYSEIAPKMRRMGLN